MGTVTVRKKISKINQNGDVGSGIWVNEDMVEGIPEGARMNKERGVQTW